MSVYECVSVCVCARCTGILKEQEQNLLSTTSLRSPQREGIGFHGLFDFLSVFFVFFLPTLAADPRAAAHQAAHLGLRVAAPGSCWSEGVLKVTLHLPKELELAKGLPCLHGGCFPGRRHP